MKLGYIIIYVKDVALTVEFYGRAFGAKEKFVHESGQYAELDTGTTTLAFAQEDFVASTCHDFLQNRGNNKPAGAEIAFVTSDVRSAYDKAIAAGAVSYIDPFQKPWGQTVSYVRDCNGFLVEICSEIG